MHDFKSQCCFFTNYFTVILFYEACVPAMHEAAQFLSRSVDLAYITIYEMETLRQRLLSPTLCMVSKQKYG